MRLINDENGEKKHINTYISVCFCDERNEIQNYLYIRSLSSFSPFSTITKCDGNYSIYY